MSANFANGHEFSEAGRKRWDEAPDEPWLAVTDAMR